MTEKTNQEEDPEV